MTDENVDANDISPEMTPALVRTIIGIGGGAVGSSMALGPLGPLAGEDLPAAGEIPGDVPEADAAAADGAGAEASTASTAGHLYH